MLCVCVPDVVFSVCIVRRGAVGTRVTVSSCRCCICVMCASCGSSQCCILHDLQSVNAGRGCKRRPYGRGILQGSAPHKSGRRGVNPWPNDIHKKHTSVIWICDLGHKQINK